MSGITVPPHHPLIEILGRKLFGIEGDLPLQYKQKMIRDAGRAIVEWHEAQMKEPEKCTGIK